MFEAAPDRFEEWLHAAAPYTCTDPRIEARQAHSSEFDRIYDLVDEIFEMKRPRAFYDWLYRRNPNGMARCWVVIERNTGQFVGVSATWPWPVARGREMLRGIQVGDWGVRPRWRGLRIRQILLDIRNAHPWHGKEVSLSWPNERIRASAEKRGRVWWITEPVRRQAALLKSGQYLAKRGWPRPVARAAGIALDGVFEGWRGIRLAGRAPGSIVEVRRFDSEFNAVTDRSVCFEGFWCPHDSEFLNWRYLEHPTRTYRAFALLTGDEVAGYYVVGIDGARAWLMDFVAPQESSHLARALLRHAIGFARDAGCAHLHCFAMRGWRHQRVFGSAGFFEFPSRLFLGTGGLYTPDIQRIENWLCVPGDTDFL